MPISQSSLVIILIQLDAVFVYDYTVRDKTHTAKIKFCYNGLIDLISNFVSISISPHQQSCSLSFNENTISEKKKCESCRKLLSNCELLFGIGIRMTKHVEIRLTIIDTYILKLHANIAMPNLNQYGLYRFCDTIDFITIGNP